MVKKPSTSCIDYMYMINHVYFCLVSKAHNTVKVVVVVSMRQVPPPLANAACTHQSIKGRQGDSCIVVVCFSLRRSQTFFVLLLHSHKHTPSWAEAPFSIDAYGEGSTTFGYAASTFCVRARTLRWCHKTSAVVDIIGRWSTPVVLIGLPPQKEGL